MVSAEAESAPQIAAQATQGGRTRVMRGIVLRRCRALAYERES